MDLILNTMKMASVNFAEWIDRKNYIRVFGRWHSGIFGLFPNKKSYTTEELYELFFIDEQKRLDKTKN